MDVDFRPTSKELPKIGGFMPIEVDEMVFAKRWLCLGRDHGAASYLFTCCFRQVDACTRERVNIDVVQPRTRLPRENT